MKKTNSVYIALGSNKGDCFNFLQLAIDSIFVKVGEVKAISKVYKTPALGFNGPDFLNACVEISTLLDPITLLAELKTIESELGRLPNTAEGYQSREIDLDVLFYDDAVFEAPSLSIPHKSIQDRRFVLTPLNDICSDFVHPVLNKSIGQLLNFCSDKSQINATELILQIPKVKHRFNNFNFIAIEGNIGAGKTSLATMISEDFNAKLILERFADNPFLPKFYKDQERYAFTLEMSFLADRYQQISDDLSQLDLFKDFIVADYDVHKSLVFSKVTLPEDEFRLYRKLFYQVYKDIPKPDLYIYLYQNTKRLQENIKKRGRDYEIDIKDEYLDQINTGYLEFLKSQTELNLKIIDISDKDFIRNRADYLWLIEQICAN